MNAMDPDYLPPTTNFLNHDERAGLVKKSRKLAKVFGKTPGAADFTQPQDDPRNTFLGVPAMKPGHREAPSVSNDLSGDAASKAQKRASVWPPPEGTQFLTANGRRH